MISVALACDPKDGSGSIADEQVPVRAEGNAARDSEIGRDDLRPPPSRRPGGRCRRTGWTRAAGPSRSKASDVAFDRSLTNGTRAPSGADLEDGDRRLLARATR